MTSSTADLTLAPKAGPKISALVAALKESVTDASLWLHRMLIADSVRHTIWPGQTDDGRKWRASDEDDEPFPWEGAADGRIRLADRLVRDHDRVCGAAFRKGRWKAAPEEANDFRTAHKATQLLRYMVQKRMRPHSRRALTLAVDWRNHYGVSVSHVWWERRLDREPREFTADDLLEAAGLTNLVAFAQSQGTSAAAILNQPELLPEEVRTALAQEISTGIKIGELFMDDAQIDKAVALIFTLTGTDATPEEVRAEIEQLRLGHPIELPVVRQRLNRPRWEPLVPFRHVFFPAPTTALEEAEWIAVRHHLTAEQLRAKVAEEGWDEQYVKAIEAAGSGKSILKDVVLQGSRIFAKGGKRSWDAVTEASDRGYEVFTFYYRATGKFGVSALYYTVCSPHLGEEQANACAAHGICEDAHGEYPFIEHVWWRDSDVLLENVGIPYLVHTSQNELKTQRDSLVDFTSLAIRPVVRRHIRDMDTALVLRPGAPLYESTKDSTSWMSIPQGRPELPQIITKMVEAEAARLVGALDESVPAPEIMLAREAVAEDFLDEMEMLLEMTWQLIQQHMNPQEMVRVAGRLDAFPVDREEIQGRYDIRLVFDARELDTEFAAAKAKAVTDVLAVDTMGTIDRNALTELLMTAIDPNWADLVISDQQEASEREVRDEQANIALMMTGQEPKMAERGQNFGLRRQVLESTLQRSPVVQQAVQENETIRALFDARMQHLSTQEQQFGANAMIGRVGARPALG